MYFVPKNVTEAWIVTFETIRSGHPELPDQVDCVSKCSFFSWWGPKAEDCLSSLHANVESFCGVDWEIKLSHVLRFTLLQALNSRCNHPKVFGFVNLSGTKSARRARRFLWTIQLKTMSPLLHFFEFLCVSIKVWQSSWIKVAFIETIRCVEVVSFHSSCLRKHN